MRQFKFRAWNESLEEMASHEDMLRMAQEWSPLNVSHNVMLLPVAQPHIELMQCTGLKDTVGVEIYEGDILEYTSNFGGRTEIKNLLVSWSNDDGAYSFGGLRMDFVLRNSVVIGNVFENRELLE